MSVEEEIKLLNSIIGYDDLFVISNTPAFLPTSSSEEIPIKEDYRQKILDRIKTKKNTTIYMAEEGLKKISGLSIEKRRQTLKDWEDLSSKLENPGQKISVYKAGGLPCTSLIIGKTRVANTERLLYDVFLEYRINYYKKFKDPTSKDFRENKMILFYQDSLPDEITDLKNRIEGVEKKAFKDWLRENKEKGEFIAPDPEIAIISALDRELRHYQSKYEEDYYNRFRTKNRGRYIRKSGNEVLELIFAEKSYGREKTLLHTIELARQFESIRTFIFLGIAGGIPRPLPENAGEKAKRTLRLYDVVISSEVINLTYERICRTDLCNIPLNDKEKVRLAKDTYLIFKYDTHEVSKTLREKATDFVRYTNMHPKEWINFIRTYFEEVKSKSLHDLKFRNDISAIFKRIEPRVVIGRIFSSDHNVNFKPLRDGLMKVKNFADLYAFEMEGSGLANGATAFGRNFIEIRGISDLSEGIRPEEDDKVNQTVAAIVASAALDKFLSYIYEHD